MNDFDNSKHYQYGAAHLLFTNKVPQHLMVKMANVQVLMERIKSLKEFNLEFSCKFDNQFNLDYPESLPILFSSHDKDKHLHQNTVFNIADKLSTVIASLEKFYAVEIVYNQAQNRLSEEIASSVYDRLNEVIDNLKKDKNQETYDEKSGKVTVIVLDRSIDPLTPLVRDFYYQPMMYDLLDVQNDTIEFESENQEGKIQKTKAIFEDTDDLFSRYKFRHIGEVMEGIPNEFKDFCQQNATAQFQKGQLTDLDLNKMSEVIKTMPQYKELLKKYNMHIKLIQDCWKIFEEKDLNEIGELEQSLVTGLNESGKSVTPSTMMKSLSARLQSNKLSEQDKLRLVLITIISLEMVENDRKALTDKISVDDQRAVLNLMWLGVTPQQSSGKKKGKSKGRVDKKIKQAAMSKLQSSTLSLSRNTTVLETLMDEILNSNNPDQIFKTLPSNYKSLRINCDQLQNAKGSGQNYKKISKMIQIMGNDDESELANKVPKIIVFIAGGLSYNEVRALRNLDSIKDKVLIIGGTQYLKPNDYIKGLLDMNDPF